MESISIQKASQLDLPAREWLQRLFGRAFSEDEPITIVVAAAHQAPSSEDRKDALRRMDTVLDKAAENMADVSDADFDEAVDEAMLDIRKRN